MIPFKQFVEQFITEAYNGVVMMSNASNIIDSDDFREVCRIIQGIVPDGAPLLIYDSNKAKFNLFKVNRLYWSQVQDALTKLPNATVDLSNKNNPKVKIKLSDSPISEITLIAGNGSVSATGEKRSNKGNEYEHILTGYIQDYINDNSNIHPDIKKLVSLFPDIVAVEHMGGNNTNRPMTLYGDYYAPQHPSDYNLGPILGDLAIVDSQGKKTYISVKFGDTVTVVNPSIAPLFNGEDFETGEVSKKTLTKLGPFLKSFGIDVYKFVESFYNYKASNGTPEEKLKLNPSQYDRKAVENFIKASFGAGYVYFHKQKNGSVHLMQMTRALLTNIAQIKSIEVVYKNSKAKEVQARIDTSLVSINVRFRNRHGGTFPTSAPVQYKFKH